MGSRISWAGKLRTFAAMIKFEHTLFALPFAYLGLWLAERGHPRWRLLFWVTLAMAGMRTAAMCINRLVDREIDKANPRTQSWAIPQGLLSPVFVSSAAAGAAAIYFFSASMLNTLCLYLSPLPLALAAVYPYLKRFTWSSHFFLGMILGIAPAAGWIASRASISVECWLLFFAVLFWVTGFDMIYALQDALFDRSYGLQSFPARFDTPATLQCARVLHAGTVFLLLVLGPVAQLGEIYYVGWVFIVLFLLREHWLVAKAGLEKIQEAFFQMNVLVSTVLFFATWLDLAWG